VPDCALVIIANPRLRAGRAVRESFALGREHGKPIRAEIYAVE
jgi:hypothetical protein